MKRMQSPKPNRKGVYEIHSVPSRKADQLAARGWTDIDAAGALPDADQTEKTAEATKPREEQKQAQRGPLTESLRERPQFDLSGHWLKTRAQVRDELGMSRVPTSKDEARAMLEDAGYEVTEA